MFESDVFDGEYGLLSRGQLTIRPFAPRLPCHIYMTRNRIQVSSMLQRVFEREFRTALEDNRSGNVRTVLAEAGASPAR